MAARRITTPKDDDEGSEASANERAAARVEEEVARAKRRTDEDEEDEDDDEEEEDDAVEVEEDEEEEDVVVVQPPRKPRQERRRERLSLLEAKREADTQLAEMRERLARIEGENSARERLTPKGESPPDPYEREVDRISREQNMVNTEFSALPPEQQQAREAEFRKRWHDLDREKLRIIARSEFERSGGGQRQVDPERAAYQAALRMQHPDLFPTDRPNVTKAFQAEYQRLVLVGHADHPDTVKLAADNTRKAFRMPIPGRPAPTVQERARLSGQRSSSGGAPTGSGPTKIKITKEIRMLATAAYPNLSEKDAVARWAKRVGAKQAKRGEL